MTLKDKVVIATVISVLLLLSLVINAFLFYLFCTPYWWIPSHYLVLVLGLMLGSMDR